MTTRRTRKFGQIGGVTLAVAMLVASATAAAQDGFSAQRFFPAPSQSRDFLSLYSTQTGSHFDWEAGLWFNYGDALLVERDRAGEVTGEPVAGLFVADVVASFSFLDRFAIGLDIPIVLLHSSSVSGSGALDDLEAGAGVGDIRLIPRVSIWSTQSESGLGFSLAGILPVYLPTGDRAVFHGSGFQLHPTLAAELAAASGVRTALNLGVAIRSEGRIANPINAQLGEDADMIVVNEAFLLGAGVEIPVEDMFRFTGEINSEIGFGSGSVTPVEALVGGEIALDFGLVANLAFGRGLSGGFGAPNFRVVFGAGYAFDYNPDRDSDGILNRDDECPDVAEDLDGFEDEDGCPDEDNDGDGVPDIRDRCPNSPEDFDGFEDTDGCPELDNDADGVFDIDDACPDVAEDRDGFEDSDGCPDLDNDGDGIPDTEDRCPDNAEDVDGFEDTDGCPDLDNDNDMILDVDDACPLEPETVNGLDDTDGCPDVAPIELRQATGEIRLLEPLSFEGSSDDIAESALPVLEAIATAMRNYPALRVRVVVHSFDRRDEEQRVAMSQRRADAVVAALVERGVDAAKLQTSAYAIPESAGETATRVEIRLVR